MAIDDSDTNEQSQDVDFVDAMHDMFNMSEEQVNDVLEKLNADELQELTDAVAKHDIEAAKQVLSQTQTDEEVNSLFRGKNLQAQQEQKRKHKPVDANAQFAIGDDVLVNMKKDGKTETVSATVANPHGPEGTDTVIVKIKGKSVVVDKKNLYKLDETMLGMVGIPGLTRIRQLAGIQNEIEPAAPTIPEIDVEADIEPMSDVEDSDPLSQVMSAFDKLEATLPSIQLADLKCVRERLTALQTSLNENRIGRTRKL